MNASNHPVAIEGWTDTLAFSPCVSKENTITECTLTLSIFQRHDKADGLMDVLACDKSALHKLDIYQLVIRIAIF